MSNFWSELEKKIKSPNLNCKRVYQVRNFRFEKFDK